MQNPRKNIDRGLPNGYGGKPYNPGTPVATGKTPTFNVPVVSTDVDPDNAGGGIPIAIQYLQDGSIPIFWGNHQVLNATTKRYTPPSNMTIDSTMAIPEVVRFLYAYSKNNVPDFCAGGVSPPPPVGCFGEIVLFGMQTNESSLTGDVTLFSSIPAAGTNIYFGTGDASGIFITAMQWKTGETPQGYFSGSICSYNAFVISNPPTPSWNVPSVSGITGCCSG